MLTLFSYPGLYGLADNNPFGLKVFAFLRLCGVPFRHLHILDTRDAPRGQLPYLTDGDQRIGDSDTIIAHLTRHHGLAIDSSLTPDERDRGFLLNRALDDLYWVMSYARWRDDRFWPRFRDAFCTQHPEVTPEVLQAAREFNFKRYHYQGIGRYEPDAAYARGIADLDVLARMIPESGFLFGPRPSSFDAAAYGFVANILFFEIDTPLRARVMAHPNLVTHCRAIHAMLAG